MKAQWEAVCASGVASETVDLAVNASKSLSYTGAAKCLLFAKDGNYKFELWGASGGQYESTAYGGKGGYVAGTMPFSKNENIYVYIGGSGASSSVSNTGTLTRKAGGWNGGGVSANQAACCSNRYWGSGGGASDIRTVYGAWDDGASLRSRIMVASGGGGSYYGGSGSAENAIGGHGGGLTGYNGRDNYSTAHSLTANSYPGGSGGSQVSGGIATRYEGSTYSPAGFGYGGSLGNANAGGGSGWYGGGGSEHVSSAGGGSSYISGHTGSVAVTSTSSSSPKSGCTTGTTTNSCSVSPFGYTFTNTLMIDGAGYKWTNTKGSLQAMPKPTSGNYGSGVGHTGNGYARITYLGN